MALSKDMSTLTPAELMEIAKKPIKRKKESNLSPIKDFIISEGIVVGDAPISALIVYDRYLTWCRNYVMNAISMTIFLREFKFHFNKIRKSSKHFYMLDPKGFDLTKEAGKVLSEQYMKRISRGKKKNKKKQSRKINQEEKED